MSPNDISRERSRPQGAAALLADTTPSLRDYALLEEFSFVRREAQAEADLAYEQWHVHGCRESYAVYRAAQDRADAAQDDLADWTRRLAA
ncbi:MAG TPA: hypothetical protein VG410_10135 [Solirubrobacteraceae bacterium]|jgi:sarcosine oxidase delta subunit|nr:hypothetical protein [Solirubrobacteraceae bacterium]